MKHPMNPSAATPETASLIPSAAEVVALHRAVERDGPGAHAVAIDHLRSAAGRLGVEEPLVELLTDRSSPDPVRVRAVGRLASRWNMLAESVMVHDPVFASTFDALLTRWNTHHDLRSTGVGIAQLAASQRAVDEARRAHHAARRPLRAAC